MSRPFFTLGFVLGIGLFVTANVHSYHVAEPPCCDFSVPFGVPFPLGQTGGFISVTRFMLLGVIADVIVGLIASVGFAWMFAKSFPSIINRIVSAIKQVKNFTESNTFSVIAIVGIISP